MDLLFYDTETTGFGECRLVELAYALAPTNCGLIGDPEIITFRVKPIIPIEEGATKVHGISDEDVAGHPYFHERQEHAMLAEVFPACLAVAHNAPFDRGVMQREGIAVPHCIDTKIIARQLYPDAPDYRLQTLREHLGIELDVRAHSAGGDVAVLIALFKEMQKKLMKVWGENAEEALTRMARF